MDRGTNEHTFPFCWRPSPRGPFVSSTQIHRSFDQLRGIIFLLFFCLLFIHLFFFLFFPPLFFVLPFRSRSNRTFVIDENPSGSRVLYLIHPLPLPACIASKIALNSTRQTLSPKEPNQVLITLD